MCDIVSIDFTWLGHITYELLSFQLNGLMGWLSKGGREQQAASMDEGVRSPHVEERGKDMSLPKCMRWVSEWAEREGGKEESLSSHIALDWKALMQYFFLTFKLHHSMTLAQ